jgi:hypothetical protein
VTDEVRLLANTVVGLGFSYRAFQQGLRRAPDMIGCDAGSSDFGPFYLGSGLDPKSPRAVRRDLEIMLTAAVERSIPLVIGSCGGAGADVHLEGYARLVREIAAERGLHFRLATISAEQPKRRLAERLAAGRIRPLGPVPELTAGELEASERVVAMMGVEPIQAALDGGADVVLAGRASDPAIFSPVALRRGVDAGLAWHAAKSIDKGGLATESPGEGSPVLVSIGADGFTVEPCKPGSRCTVATVAAMTMHENPDPYRIAQPGGTIETSAVRYEQVDDRRVRVTGSRFVSAERYTVKLEGAAHEGHRSLLIAGVRDPRVVGAFDEFLPAYEALIGRVTRSMDIEPEQYRVNFRCYGRDGVLGDRESRNGAPPREIGLIVDVVADTAELSRAIATRLGPLGSRLDVTGHQGGGGNFAYPFSPSVIDVGPVYRWSVWHLLEVDAGELPELFPVAHEEV